MMMNVAVLLFNDFETLDVFGPVEILGRNKELFLAKFYSQFGGHVQNSHGVSIESKPLTEIEAGVDIFIIPGGYGTRLEVNNDSLIELIKSISENSKYVFTVCTGTAL
jgi:putative intracellular protease/amidase